MDEPFYLGAYWGPRRESVEDCAERLARCLGDLAACNDSLAQWSKKPSGAVEVTTSSLRELLLAGVNRRDADGTPIAELGFSAGLWNGDRKVPVGLSVTCGAWTSTPGVMNAVVLDLPTPGEAPALYELDTARCLMRAVVEAWEPDWATLTTYELADALDAGPREPAVGWLTFLAGGRPVAADVPARREELGSGALLVAAERVEDVGVARVSALAGALRSVGALTPTP
jgi:hypothetical protein